MFKPNQATKRKDEAQGVSSLENAEKHKGDPALSNIIEFSEHLETY